MKIKKKYFFLLCGLALAVVAIVVYLFIFRPPLMPKNGMHKESSNFVCLGCHNNGRKGSSFKFHYDDDECVTCH